MSDLNPSVAVNLVPLTSSQLENFLIHHPDEVQNWVKAAGFKAEPYQVCLVPSADRTLSYVLVGYLPQNHGQEFANLAQTLPENTYQLSHAWLESEPVEFIESCVFYWLRATYTFTPYKKNKKTFPTLIWPEALDQSACNNRIRALFLVRDLINTPASDMGPAELAIAAETLAKEYHADFKVIVGEDLLKENYPAIYHVGKASARPPRLIDIKWGESTHPKVTLIGKGVCFDSGGLDLKSSSNMLLMKKDMGGAAHALGLAHLIMSAKLPVYLRVLIPAVENSISGNAMRPLDVIQTRQKLTIEIGNTDAEGRLILADALTAACEEAPDLIIDFATLTGAARVALGPALPALFSNTPSLAQEIMALGEKKNDPLWHMPLFEPYREHLKSTVADLNNCGSSPYAGAITAALFLKEFVNPSTPWLHVDLMAWNLKARPGHPEGGEAMGLFTFYAYLLEKYQPKLHVA